MNTLLDWPPLPIPISDRLRQQAETTSQSDISQQELAEERYQRSLATLIVQYYLRLIAVPHRLDSLASGPALYLEELGGYIACCATSPGAERCKIPQVDRNGSQTPPEQARKGYLFVALSSPYHTAQILGFTPTATVSELPLSYLQPLSAFTEALEQSETSATPAMATIPRILVTDWAKGLIAGWQRLGDIPVTRQPAAIPLVAMRSAQPLTSQPASEKNAADLMEVLATTTDDVARWQAAERLVLLDSRSATEASESARWPMPTMSVKPLADTLNGLPVALLVGIVTKPDGTFLVGCRLYAVGSLQALPENLRLQGIEEEAQADKKSSQERRHSLTFCDLTPATHGDPLEYLFTAEAGDCFSLNIHDGDVTATHTFVLPPAEP